MLSKVYNFLITVSLLKITDEKCIHDNHTRLYVDNPIMTPDPNTKYILVWTARKSSPPPFNQRPDLQDLPFRNLGCRNRNCYYTSDRRLLSSATEFHAILFHGKEMKNFRPPVKRSNEQLYVYVMDESVTYYPMRSCIYDDFFNLTITYKLDSDVTWPYFRVIDKIDKSESGPKIGMKWKKKQGQLDPEYLEKLSNKTELAAWFVSNCRPKNMRNKFFKRLMKELRSISNFSVHVYGRCGGRRCAKYASEKCDQMLSEKYLFYLAFENSDDEDYVTEKVLRALQNDMVPVVYGGADYSRFLPPDSYLDAKRLGPKTLAILMTYLHLNRTLYHKFFRWKLRYEFRDTVMDYSCELCARLNSKYNELHRHPKLSDWWNGDNITSTKCTYNYLVTSKQHQLHTQIRSLISQIDGIKKSLVKIQKLNRLNEE